MKLTVSTAPESSTRETIPSEAWAHTTFGYRVENENGFVGNLDYPPQTHGQRLNNDALLPAATRCGPFRFDCRSAFHPQQRLRQHRRSARRSNLAGIRGRRDASPELACVSPMPPDSKNRVSKKPSPVLLTRRPNTALKPERSRSFEAGMQQNFLQGRYVFTATYFNNLFHDQINYVTVDPMNFIGQYANVNQALAHGAEAGLQAKLRSHLLLNTSYTYTSTQILANPAPINSLYNQASRCSAAQSIPRLPSCPISSRWGGNLAEASSDAAPTLTFWASISITPPGYVRADLGGWYAVHPRITLYANLENALDRHYNEVVGYPALPINFRAGHPLPPGRGIVRSTIVYVRRTHSPPPSKATMQRGK